MEFPRLQGERLDIDCLRPQEGSYSIDSEPGDVAQRYLDGSTVQRFPFTISGWMDYAIACCGVFFAKHRCVSLPILLPISL